PRMTSAERAAIGSPANGLMVFDSTTLSFWFFDGTNWKEITLNTDGQTLSLTGTTLSIANGNSVDLSGLGGADNDWTASGTDLYNANIGNIGIGTSSPDTTAKLHVDLPGNLTDGVLVTGTFNGAATYPDLGAGSRLMFYPGKGAFRAGEVNGTQWDNAFVGNRSVAFGLNNIASGGNAAAFGSGNTVAGQNSAAIGLNNSVSSDWSFSIGKDNTVGSDLSFAGGNTSTASGLNSFAFGWVAEALGAHSFAFGDEIVAQGDGSFAIALSDQNGAVLSQANTMAIMGGNVGISTLSPSEALEVNGNIRMTDGNEQAGYVMASDINGTASWTDPTSVFTDTDDQTLSLTGTTLTIADGNSVDLSPLQGQDNDWTPTGSDLYNANAGNIGIGTSSPQATGKLHVDVSGSNTDGFLVTGDFFNSGSVPNLGTGSRMMFYPGKSAFRAGFGAGTDWDNANVGDFSFAGGSDNLASGDGSFAMGVGAEARGNYAVALGFVTDANGYASFVMGNESNATGDHAVALGKGNMATGLRSIAFGYQTKASGNTSTAFGSGITAQGNYSVAIGL
ncbi:MAG: hypothetical protein KDC44_08170, partial [Phaeodactylibacter sp.]|nr:hypothetical protein [Phaeodactylibacter sp.]